MLQLVTAIIKPFKVDDVKDALKKVHISGVTITEVKGFGRQGGKTETYRGSEYTVDFLPKIKVEIVTDDEHVAEAVEAITTAAQTGQIGDGKVWVTDLNQLVRIRTGELGADAI